MQDGITGAFYDLLTAYGIWACYLGCSGYATGKSRKTAWIDDDSAMIIDACFMRLKNSYPQIWQIMRMYYIQDMDTLDILSVLRRAKRSKRRQNRVIRGQNYYGFDPAYAETLLSVGPKEIMAIKKRGDEMIYNYLLEMV